MRRKRHTKVVATLGPASSDRQTVAKLFAAGADVFRLNFSHGSHEDHRNSIGIVRAIEEETGKPIGALMDLQGPKLRIGRFAGGGTRLDEGAQFRLDMSDRPGDARRVRLPHPEVYAAIGSSQELLLDDGKLRLRVTRSGADFADTVVEAGGELSDRKGVNVPGVVLPLSPLTEKDRADLQFGLDLGVDWVAQSFVQRPEDVAELRKLVAGRAAVMVKLEKPAAVDRLDEVIDLCDALMLARGDLGVEMPPEDVPGVQKRVIRACRGAGKPVVVATQMLDSMVNSPSPTRAEASDVATAVYDGADALMLSTETASGKYPVESVAIMDRIIARTEQDPAYRRLMDAHHPDPEATGADAISAAAAQVAQTIGAAAIVTYSMTGSTTLRMARERPQAPILGLTASKETARRMPLVWGIHSILSQDVEDFTMMVNNACALARSQALAGPGDRLVITAGVPFGTPGATNVLRIAWVND
ncbi:MAG: pyruvate kinase [Kiloniellales bacterium]